MHRVDHWHEALVEHTKNREWTELDNTERPPVKPSRDEMLLAIQGIRHVTRI